MQSEVERETEKNTECYLTWLTAYQFLMGYLLPKFDSFVNVWLKSYLFFQYFIDFLKYAFF